MNISCNCIATGEQLPTLAYQFLSADQYQYGTIKIDG